MTAEEEIAHALEIINSGAPAACHLEDCRLLSAAVRVLIDFAWRAVNPPQRVAE